MDKWLEIKDKTDSIIKDIESTAFNNLALKKQCYVESSQITIEVLGDFSPKDEMDLVLKYDNNEEFINKESKVVTDLVLKNINYQIKIGKIRF